MPVPLIDIRPSGELIAKKMGGTKSGIINIVPYLLVGRIRGPWPVMTSSI